MNKDQVVLRVLLKTGGGVDFMHTRSEAESYLKGWKSRKSAAMTEELQGTTQDGVSWAIALQDISGLLVMPMPTQQQYQQPVFSRS